MQEDRAGFLLCKRAVHLLVPFVEWSFDKEAHKLTLRMDGKTKMVDTSLSPIQIDELVISEKQHFVLELLMEGIPKSAPGMTVVKG